MSELTSDIETLSNAVAAVSDTITSESVLDMDKYLTFRVGSSNFGIDLLRIKEIIEYASVCDIPMAPTHIRGVINLRGNVVPVIDLARRISVDGDVEESKRTCIIIIDIQVQGESIDLGIVVDAVNKVYEIDADDVEQAPAFGANIRADFIKGMGRISKEFIVLLELDRVLDIDELAIGGFAENVVDAF